MAQILLYGWLGTILLKLIGVPPFNKIDWKILIIAPIFYYIAKAITYVLRYVIAIVILFGVVYWVCDLGTHICK